MCFFATERVPDEGVVPARACVLGSSSFALHSFCLFLTPGKKLTTKMGWQPAPTSPETKNLEVGGSGRNNSNSCPCRKEYEYFNQQY